MYHIIPNMTRIKPLRKEPSARTLGETIRDLRKANGLTQGELAREVGVDESYISKIETGRLSYMPSEETLRLMAKKLGADALVLLSLAQKAPHELRDVVDSESAREFFKIVSEQQVNTEDWHDLTRRLRSRISKRRGGR
jgi:HTH-type transcriptional regulator, competence development regulator